MFKTSKKRRRKLLCNYDKIRFRTVHRTQKAISIHPKQYIKYAYLIYNNNNYLLFSLPVECCGSVLRIIDS